MYRSASKDRFWFGDDYMPIQSHINAMVGPPMPVIGIGTVTLPVRKSLQRSGPDGHGTLVIKNVLHVPTAICNIVSAVCLERSGYGAVVGVTNLIHSLATNETVALLPHGKGRYSDLVGIRLSGFPVGPRVAPTPPKDGSGLILTITLSNEERNSVNAQLAARRRAAGQAPVAAAAVTEPPLNEEEKRFLKANFRDEFHFLREHDLNIHKEEHRDSGRTILRALMSQDEEYENSEEDEEEDEHDFERHLADHHFTEEQLDFIERGYGSSMAFMHSFGLKFYNDEDCEEAKAIVEAFMTDD